MNSVCYVCTPFELQQLQQPCRVTGPCAGHHKSAQPLRSHPTYHGGKTVTRRSRSGVRVRQGEAPRRCDS
eukprot:scaffold6029_cov277-Pinguiococcus_pyrenoidosus.AAC.1